jgi:site-specific DNA-cytosine methylase
MTPIQIRHAHLFCGLGAAAHGFNKGSARVGSAEAHFRCIGGIDVDAAAIADFGRLAGVPGTLLDLFSREQFIAFHGREPDPDWHEATTADIHRAFGHERPHIAFLSAPCKGFSGLLSETSSKSAKYQALNALTLRGMMLLLEAYRDDPVELIIFENVPRIATRGRQLLDQIVGMLRSYGYAVAETTHDCGELGGLAQSRKRFLLVARHEKKVPPFLYEPEKRRLRGVGEVLEHLPIPGPEPVLPMHRMPMLQWKTWVRLAFVEAGSDWRSLNKLRIEDGHLADYVIAPDVERHGGYLGVRGWDEPSATISSRGTPTTGAYSVADPRHFGLDYQQYGVRRWDENTGAVINVKAPGQGGFSVADPRLEGTRFNNIYRIVGFDETSPAVTGGGAPSAGGIAVADPRPAPRDDYKQTKYRVTGIDEPAGTVIAASTTGNGAFAVADPRPPLAPEYLHGKHHVTPFDQPSRAVIGGRENGAWAVADPRPDFAKDGKPLYTTGGHYGVLHWEDASGGVTASGQHDNGRWSVADPRPATGEAADTLPAPSDRLFCVIRALDGTWHRPFTTLELAALQGLVDPEETLELHGVSDSAWRERIGNAVPPPAAQAIAGVMGRTLLLAWAGETFMLSSEPIWVRDVAVGLSVDERRAAQ